MERLIKYCIERVDHLISNGHYTPNVAKLYLNIKKLEKSIVLFYIDSNSSEAYKSFLLANPYGILNEISIDYENDIISRTKDRIEIIIPDDELNDLINGIEYNVHEYRIDLKNEVKDFGLNNKLTEYFCTFLNTYIVPEHFSCISYNNPFVIRKYHQELDDSDKFKIVITSVNPSTTSNTYDIIHEFKCLNPIDMIGYIILNYQKKSVVEYYYQFL